MEDKDYENDQIVLSEDEEDEIEITLNEDKTLKTNKKVTKYEKLSILINRIEQINGGAEPLISNIDSFTSVEDIVYEEYRQNKIPFIIKRTLNNNTELIKFKDLVK
jgi:DNA-directed RNA polymerase subunit K/omega